MAPDAPSASGSTSEPAEPPSKRSPAGSAPPAYGVGVVTAPSAPRNARSRRPRRRPCPRTQGSRLSLRARRTRGLLHQRLIRTSPPAATTGSTASLGPRTRASSPATPNSPRQPPARRPPRLAARWASSSSRPPQVPSTPPASHGSSKADPPPSPPSPPAEREQLHLILGTLDEHEPIRPNSLHPRPGTHQHPRLQHQRNQARRRLREQDRLGRHAHPRRLDPRLCMRPHPLLEAPRQDRPGFSATTDRAVDRDRLYGALP